MRTADRSIRAMRAADPARPRRRPGARRPSTIPTPADGDERARGRSPPGMNPVDIRIAERDVPARAPRAAVRAGQGGRRAPRRRHARLLRREPSSRSARSPSARWSTPASGYAVPDGLDAGARGLPRRRRARGLAGRSSGAAELQAGRDACSSSAPAASSGRSASRPRSCSAPGAWWRPRAARRGCERARRRSAPTRPSGSASTATSPTRCARPPAARLRRGARPAVGRARRRGDRRAEAVRPPRPDRAVGGRGGDAWPRPPIRVASRSSIARPHELRGRRPTCCAPRLRAAGRPRRGRRDRASTSSGSPLDACRRRLAAPGRVAEPQARDRALSARAGRPRSPSGCRAKRGWACSRYQANARRHGRRRPITREQRGQRARRQRGDQALQAQARSGRPARGPRENAP